MKSLRVKFAALALLAGVLSSCASPAANTPVPQSTEAPVLITETSTNAPAAATDTSVPAAESTSTAAAASSGGSVSFANDILPLLESRCVKCHGGDRTEKDLNLTTYAQIMAGSEDGPVVTPGDAANSSLAEMVSNGKMPKRGPKLTPPQVQLIVGWIDQGAHEN